MTTLCWAACKALLEKQPDSQRNELLIFLPPSQQEEIKKAPTHINFFSSLSPEILDFIHPSWLVQSLQRHTENENERSFFLAALQPVLGKEIKKQLAITRSLPSLTPFGKNYLRREWLGQIKKERGEAFPQNALSESAFNILLELDARQLSLLSFRLGLYDLAEELRYVIDKQTLQFIEETLTPFEWQMLKNFQTKKERLTFGRMPLKKVMNEPLKLRLAIEQYGMNRLGKALYGEDSSLLWHLLLRMDQKRANFLSTLCTPPAKPELNETIKHQVLALVPQILERPKKEE